MNVNDKLKINEWIKLNEGRNEWIKMKNKWMKMNDRIQMNEWVLINNGIQMNGCK